MPECHMREMPSVWFPLVRRGSGSDVYTERLASALSKRGFRVQLTALPGYYEFAPWLLERVTPPVGTNIIHANSWNGFAFRRHGLPLVVTEHQGWFGHGRPYHSQAQRFYHQALIRRYVAQSLAVADQVVAVSHATAEGLQRAFGPIWQQLCVIPNWVDTERFCPADEPAELHSDTELSLLYVGNLAYLKGVDVLRELMLALPAGFRLLYTSGLKDKGRHWLADITTAHCVGRISDEAEMIRLYQQADIFVFPSRFESFGLAPLEAMACGKPVVASDAFGLSELLADGAGYLCPPGNVAEFAAAIRKLATSALLRQQLGAAARARAERAYAEPVCVDQYVAMYQRLLGC